MKTTAVLATAEAAALLLYLPVVLAQTSDCGDVLTPSYPAPVVGSGWTARLIVTGLKDPRGLLFDSSGNLLVVEQEAGIRRLSFTDGGDTCLQVAENTQVVQNSNVGFSHLLTLTPMSLFMFISVIEVNSIPFSSDGSSSLPQAEGGGSHSFSYRKEKANNEAKTIELTHGIALSNDGETLFASTPEEVLAWSYDTASASVGDDTTPRVVIDGMNDRGHATRTLLMSQKAPGTLLVSQGSGANDDPLARNASSGISQIRSFDVRTLPREALTYRAAGTLLGWGLRNSVGVAEEPRTGGIYSVENSFDGLARDGVDIHQNNPGEEMNYHGFLNGSSSAGSGQGDNYGYPECFAVWDPTASGLGGMKVGDQFTPSTSDVTTDSVCQDHFVAPRLTWPAHTAPLDIKFTADGSEAFVSFHGSWDRSAPAGYVLASVAFDPGTGEPVEPRTSNASLRSILSNGDLSGCPDACFRPAGLALDAAGRLFMSSDSTGEIYVLARAELSITGDPPSSSPSSSTATSISAAAATDGSGAVDRESGARRSVVAPSRAFPFAFLFFGGDGGGGGGGGGGNDGSSGGGQDSNSNSDSNAVLGLGLMLLAYSLASCLAGLLVVTA
ncbi:hypothetical protein SLS62_009864 [Diatrype stigma]|uniref:Pyrroloquinoline quinone-dependent pyranose dehydrogenase beta-propeller domain-containing protein n=1 Tax=Diatrype stigma TaxID=117547 RepID=A0AAN9YK11_9PEZI